MLLPSQNDFARVLFLFWVEAKKNDELYSNLHSPGSATSLGIVVGLELECSVNVDRLLERATDAHGNLLVVSGFGPQRYPEKGFTNRYHDSTNFILVLEGLTNACKHRVEPDVVNFTHGLVARQLDAPLSTVLVGRVLPHGLDALLEKMVVGADGQVAGLHDVVVDTPKVLDSVKGDEFLQRLLPVVGVGLLARVIEPEGPGVVKGMFYVEVDGIVKDGDVFVARRHCEVVVLSHGGSWGVGRGSKGYCE